MVERLLAKQKVGGSTPPLEASPSSFGACSSKQLSLLSLPRIARCCIARRQRWMTKKQKKVKLQISTALERKAIRNIPPGRPEFF